MTARLKDKVVIITGGASGIGAATAELFAAQGAKLILADIQVDGGRALAERLAGVFVEVDVTDEQAVSGLVDTALSRFGRLDVMLNNAGAPGPLGPITGITAEAWEKTLALLLNSVFYGMKHAARAMIPQASGAILTTSSSAAVAAVGPLPYTAAKHAITGLTRSLASELAPHGISVNAVAPGIIATPLMGGANLLGSVAAAEAAAASVPMGRPVTPADIAASFLYLASEEGSNITGQTIVVDGGLTTVVRRNR